METTGARRSGRASRPLTQAIRRTLGLPLVVSIGVSLAVWWLFSERVFEFLPTPAEVAIASAEFVTSAELYTNLAVTLRRVALVSVGAWFMALVIGILMARNWAIETIAHPFVFVGLAMPAPLAVLFTILAFGLGELTILIALWFLVTPYVITFVYDGTKALDAKYEEMGTVYQFSTWLGFRHVVLPQLAPALMSGARFGFAIGWKLVVLVEALAATVGVGERIHFYFVFNQPAEVIALSLLFTVVLLAAELLLFQRLDKRLFVWRQTSSSTPPLQ